MSQCKTNILSNCSSILGFLRTGQLTLISYFNAILIVFYQHFTILSTINKDIIIIIIIITIIIIIIHLFTGQRGIQNPVKHLRWSLFRKNRNLICLTAFRVPLCRKLWYLLHLISSYRNDIKHTFRWVASYSTPSEVAEICHNWPFMSCQNLSNHIYDLLKIGDDK